MNLVIDAGNTTVKVAVFDDKKLLEVINNTDYTLQFLQNIVSKYVIDQAIVASVVDLPQKGIEKLDEFAFSLIWLDKQTPLPIKNLYKTPDTLGYDRIAAVVAANEQYPDRDILVIDAGSAITYEFIDREGQYHGGNISPGTQMRFNALNHFTGRLPLIEPKGEIPSIGYDTETAIRAGVLKGLEYEITGYITSLKYKYPELLVFLTGGDEFSFDTNLKNDIFADRFLVLKGLNRILNYNNDKE